MTFLPPLTASSSNVERAGPSTSSQGALEPARGSQGPENSRLPSERGARQRAIRPRLHEDQETSQQRRGCRGRARTTAPRTNSISRRSTQQRSSWSSRGSPVVAPRRSLRLQGTGRERSRSPLHRASRSQSQPRSRGSRQMPHQAAQSSTLGSASPGTSGPSGDSVVREHRRPSRQQGRSRP